MERKQLLPSAPEGETKVSEFQEALKLPTTWSFAQVQPTLKIRHVTMSLVTAMTGVGILTFPKVVEQLGLLLGLCSIAGVGLLVYYLACLLSDALAMAEKKNKSRVRSLGELGEYCFGQFGSYLALSCSVIQLLGTCTCLLILIGKYTDMCIGHPRVSYRLVILAVSPFAAASGFIKDVSMLEKLAPISALISVSLPLIMIVLSSLELSKEGITKDLVYVKNIGFAPLLGKLTSILFGYNFMVTMPTLRAAMIDKGKVKKAIFGNVLIGGSLYVLAPGITYLAYTKIKSEFVDLLYETEGFLEVEGYQIPIITSISTSGIVLASTIALTCFLTFPLLINVLTMMLQEKMLTVYGSYQNFLMRGVCVSLSILFALFIPYFESFVDLLGASVLCVINILLPISCYRKLARNWGSSWFQAILNLTILIFGCLLMAVGTYQAVSQLFETIHSTDQAPANPFRFFFVKRFPRGDL